MNLLFLRVFGTAPESPDYHGPLFKEVELNPDQLSLLAEVSGDSKDSRGVLQSLGLPEVATKPQAGMACILDDWCNVRCLLNVC